MSDIQESRFEALQKEYLPIGEYIEDDLTEDLMNDNSFNLVSFETWLTESLHLCVKKEEKREFHGEIDDEHLQKNSIADKDIRLIPNTLDHMRNSNPLYQKENYDKSLEEIKWTRKDIIPPEYSKTHTIIPHSADIYSFGSLFIDHLDKLKQLKDKGSIQTKNFPIELYDLILGILNRMRHSDPTKRGSFEDALTKLHCPRKKDIEEIKETMHLMPQPPETPFKFELKDSGLRENTRYVRVKWSSESRSEDEDIQDIYKIQNSSGEEYIVNKVKIKKEEMEERVKILGEDFMGEEEIHEIYPRTFWRPIHNKLTRSEDNIYYERIYESPKGQPVEEYLKRIENRGKYIMEVIHIARKVVMALGELEANGLFHGNITPNGIFVDHKGNVTITNISFDKLIYHHSDPSKSLLIPLQNRNIYKYLPPQFYSNFDIDELEEVEINKVDVYSCGMVFYKLLLGSPSEKEEEKSEDIVEAKLMEIFQMWKDVQIEGNDMDLVAKFLICIQAMLRYTSENRPPFHVLLNKLTIHKLINTNTLLEELNITKDIFCKN